MGMMLGTVVFITLVLRQARKGAPCECPTLGRETATNLGLNHRSTSVLVLVLVSILMATSTALAGLNGPIACYF